MTDVQEIHAHAERIRASHVLGRSSVLARLFDYLLEQTLGGKAPKEIEVAIDVFGKPPEFNAAQDALVRVSVHKLRRKLADYYAHADEPSSKRLTIPKGEYRLVLEAAPASDDVAEVRAVAGKPVSPRRAATKWLVAALCLSVVANAAMFFVGRGTAPAVPAETRFLAESPVWAPLFVDNRPILIVLGDYFILGETDGGVGVRRLVREFEINSSSDLEKFKKLHPETGERYANLNLKYLPVATGFALRDVLPLLATRANGSQRARVVLTSELTPEMLKSAHIVYMGYLSGLGLLENYVFSRSQLEIGDTYDELIDRQTRRAYVSQAALAQPGGTSFYEYGYFSTFRGPTGNHIIVIAGTRDVAVMQMSEAITSRTKLDDLAHQTKGAKDFEALYEVEGMDHLNFGGELVFAAPLNSADISKSTPYTAHQN
jgi:hypothetical protein